MKVSSFTGDGACDAVKEALEVLGGIQRSAAVVKWVDQKYPNQWDERVLRSRLRRCAVNNPLARIRFPNSPHHLFRHSSGNYEIYSLEKHGVVDDRGYSPTQLIDASAKVEELRETADQIEAHSEFAYEAHLRDYLAKNLQILETGLSLWTGTLEGSLEYPLEGRRIDILAKDKASVPVVIELKLSRGHERTIGQALYYRGKLRQILGVKRVRIIMVAREITSELLIASGEVSDVELFSYVLSMQVTRAAIGAAN